jgi:hypothetical protein
MRHLFAALVSLLVVAGLALGDVDVPASAHVANRTQDGQGCCAYAAAEAAALCRGYKARGLLECRIRQRKAGHDYISFEGADEALRQVGVDYVRRYWPEDCSLIAWCERAVDAGKPAIIALAWTRTEAHAVVLVMFRDDRVAYLDSNQPGRVCWMSRIELLSRWLGSALIVR